QEQQEVVYRDRLRGHLADGDPGQPGPARRLLTRALVHRGQPALGPRRYPRRGFLPDPYPEWPPRHGQPAQPGHHHPAPDRPRLHRRRPAPPRPAALQATANDHALLADERLCRHPASIPSAPSLTASAALDDPPISFRYVTGQPTAGGIPMHAPDDSTTPSRSVTVMRRLIRPWEYRHLRAVAGVRWPTSVDLGSPWSWVSRIAAAALMDASGTSNRTPRTPGQFRRLL